MKHNKVYRGMIKLVKLQRHIPQDKEANNQNTPSISAIKNQIKLLSEKSEEELFTEYLSTLNLDNADCFIQKIKEVGNPFNSNDNVKIFDGNSDKLTLKESIFRMLGNSNKQSSKMKFTDILSKVMGMQSKPFDKSTQNGLRIKPKLKNIQNIKFINSKRFFKKSEESKSKPEPSKPHIQRRFGEFIQPNLNLESISNLTLSKLFQNKGKSKDEIRKAFLKDVIGESSDEIDDEPYKNLKIKELKKESPQSHNTNPNDPKKVYNSDLEDIKNMNGDKKSNLKLSIAEIKNRNLMDASKQNKGRKAIKAKRESYLPMLKGVEGRSRSIESRAASVMKRLDSKVSESSFGF